MDSKPKIDLRSALAIIAGWVAVTVLAAIEHRLGVTSPPTQVGYPYTNYLSTCFGLASIAIYFALSVLLGYIFRHRWSVALGMMLPWPLACALDIKHDPTTHNLFPFEAILIWFPAFLFAFLGAFQGKKFAMKRQAEKAE